MTRNPEGSTESGFMEKPRIEPATPVDLIQTFRFSSHKPTHQMHSYQCFGILGQVWYLIVSIPDLCTITYFKYEQVHFKGYSI